MYPCSLFTSRVFFVEYWNLLYPSYIYNCCYFPTHTGCLKKNAPLCLTGYRGYQKWTINKSRVSFEKLRKFPFWWAQKLLIFVRKRLRKMGPKMPTLLEKRHAFGSYKDLLLLLPFQWKVRLVSVIFWQKWGVFVLIRKEISWTFQNSPYFCL